MALSKIDVSKMITGVTPLANGGTGGTSIPATNLASGVTGTLPVGSGGTGITSGTTDQFLKFTGTTTVASSAVDPSGMTLIFDQDTSAVAEIEKTSAFSSTYDDYLLTYSCIRFTNDTGDKVLIGNSGGYTTSYDYGYRGVKDSSTNEFSAGGNYASVGMAFINSIQNQANPTQGMTGFCYIMQPYNSSTSTYFCGQSGFRNGPNNAWSTIEYWWSTASVGSHDKIKFAGQNGDNFQTNGNYKLYGLAKS